MNKIQIKIKPKLLKIQDEYILTNKQLICKFKYIVICFDHVDNEDNNEDENTKSEGLVCLDQVQFRELVEAQNIRLSSDEYDPSIHQMLVNLQSWHPSINKIDFDLINGQMLRDLDQYQLSWKDYQKYIKSIKYNNCVNNEEDFYTMLCQPCNIIDIKVHFKLTRKINTIDDLHINLNYLRKLLVDNMILWNQSDIPYLDEFTINDSKQIPFSDKSTVPCCVYPHIGLIPLDLP